LLNENNIREVDDAMRDACAIIQDKGDILPYKAVVVDEAQDMSAQAFRLIRQLIPGGDQKNDIFIVGDGHQRIYRHLMSWRHLNLFEHECYLHCRTPRIKTELGIELISPSWDGISPSFTLLFEAFIIDLCTKMPVKAVAGTINETDRKIWRMLKKYIETVR